MEAVEPRRHRPTRRDFVWAAVCGVLMLLCYRWTMTPGLWGGDSSEFALAALRLGLTHAPGNPLYVVIGHLFARLFGDAMWGLTWFSGLSGALAVALAYLTMRQLRCGTGIAALAAVYFGSHHSLWLFARFPEVYVPNLPLLALSLLSALIFVDAPSRWAARASGLAFGLSCAVYLPNLLMAPAWIPLIARPRGERVRHLMAFAIPAAFCGVAIIAWTYIRSDTAPPISAQYIPDSPRNLFFYFSGYEFGAFSSAVAGPILHPPGPLESASVFAYQFIRNWLVVGVAFALLGIVAGWRQYRVQLCALMLLFACEVGYWAPKPNGQVLGMTLPAALAMALCMAIGMQEFFHRATSPIARSFAVVLPLCATLGLLTFHLVEYRKPPDYHYRPNEPATAAIATMPESAVVFARYERYARFRYLQYAYALRPDLTFVEGGVHRPIVHEELGLIEDWKQLLYETAPVRPTILDATLVDSSGVDAHADRRITKLRPGWFVVEPAPPEE